MRYKIPKEFELVKRMELSRRPIDYNGNGYDEPKNVYIGKMIDNDRNSPEFGRQVMTQYRFVHGDGYEVYMRVPVDLYNPFVKTDLRIRGGG